MNILLLLKALCVSAAFSPQALQIHLSLSLKGLVIHPRGKEASCRGLPSPCCTVCVLPAFLQHGQAEVVVPGNSCKTE